MTVGILCQGKIFLIHKDDCLPRVAILDLVEQWPTLQATLFCAIADLVGPRSPVRPAAQIFSSTSQHIIICATLNL